MPNHIIPLCIINRFQVLPPFPGAGRRRGSPVAEETVFSFQDSARKSHLTEQRRKKRVALTPLVPHIAHGENRYEKSFGAYLCQRTQMQAGSSSPKLEKSFQPMQVEIALLPGGKMGKMRRRARYPVLSGAVLAVNAAHLPPTTANPTHGPKGLCYGSPGCSPPTSKGGRAEIPGIPPRSQRAVLVLQLSRSWAQHPNPESRPPAGSLL